MLKGVSGLLELAGGGRWSNGLRLLFSTASHLATSLDVIIGRARSFSRDYGLENIRRVDERGYRGKTEK